MNRNRKMKKLGKQKTMAIGDDNDKMTNTRYDDRMTLMIRS